MTTSASDTRATPHNIGGFTFLSSLSFEGVTSENYRVIACCWYYLREMARNRLYMCIRPNFARLEMWLGFQFEQEPIFSYKSRDSLDDGNTCLWAVAYTGRVVLVCAAFFIFRSGWIMPIVRTTEYYTLFQRSLHGDAVPTELPFGRSWSVGDAGYNLLYSFTWPTGCMS